MSDFIKEQEERNYWLQRGIQAEQQRIIYEWKQEMTCDCEEPMPHLLERIKGEK